jgi:hypothetical protein
LKEKNNKVVQKEKSSINKNNRKVKSKDWKVKKGEKMLPLDVGLDVFQNVISTSWW